MKNNTVFRVADQKKNVQYQNDTIYIRNKLMSIDHEKGKSLKSTNYAVVSAKRLKRVRLQNV